MIYKAQCRTLTLLKTGCEIRYSGRVGSYCSTCDIRRVIIVENPVMSWMRK